jgi:hypothetical protein
MGNNILVQWAIVLLLFSGLLCIFGFGVWLAQLAYNWATNLIF